MNKNNFIGKVLRYSSYRVKQYVWNLLVNGVLMSYFVPVSFRCLILNIFGSKIKGCIHGHCTLLKNKLYLGHNSFINRNCFIDNNAMVTIGNNVAVGYNTTIITSNHEIYCSEKRGCKILYLWSLKMAVG